MTYDILEHNYIIDDSGVHMTTRCQDPKKITGTRLSKLCNRSPYGTPLDAFVDINRIERLTTDKPEEGQFIRGRIIEGKQIDFMRSQPSFTIQSPEEYFKVQDAKQAFNYDFFPQVSVFGGMWDAIGTCNGQPCLFEMKTTSKPQEFGLAARRYSFTPEDLSRMCITIPTHYKLQGQLYSWLLQSIPCYFVVTVVPPRVNDEESAKSFVVDATNTFIVPVTVDKEFEMYKDIALRNYDEFVYNGFIPSSIIDAKGADKELLTVLRRKRVRLDSDQMAELHEINKEQERINAEQARLDERKTRIKTQFKAYADADPSKPTGYYIDCGDTVAMIQFVHSQRVDTARLKSDGLYDQYSKDTVSQRLTFSKTK